MERSAALRGAGDDRACGVAIEMGMATDARETGGGLRTRTVVAAPRLVREGIAALLGREGWVEIAGTGSIREAVALARRLAPGIVVMEITPQSGDALLALRALRRLRHPPRVVLVCHHCTRAQAAKAADLGVDAIIAADDGEDELRRALRGGCEAGPYLGPLAGELLRGRGASRSAEARAEAVERLTTRERQVLALVAQGRTEREIARDLGLSPKTVHTYRTSLMRGLGAHNVIALVRRAVELGLVEL
jgi:DNA-binding NarL/FixJ family response regulator